MINNNRNNGNNNNNRRRGRTNRPGGNGGGGGQQLNRVDSRARGNAPQLLEKYRKLAQDAHQNGDRVQAEYYLQFADHYFRVLADQRNRQEEQRLRRDDRWDGGAEENAEEAGEFSVESDFPAFDQPSYQRREREEQPREERQPREDRSPREDRPRDNRAREDRPREDRPRNEPQRGPRSAGDDQQRPQRQQAVVAETPRVADAGGENATPSAYEPPENPFVRETGTGRGLRPRRAPRAEADRDRPDRGDGVAEAGSAGIDPSILPPSIALSPVDLAADDPPAGDMVPVKRPRGRPRKVPVTEAG